MGPCASMAACAGKDLGVDTHRFTVYEDQILKAIDDLSVLLKPTSTVNEQVSCVALHRMEVGLYQISLTVAQCVCSNTASCIKLLLSSLARLYSDVIDLG